MKSIIIFSFLFLFFGLFLFANHASALSCSVQTGTYSKTFTFSWTATSGTCPGQTAVGSSAPQDECYEAGCTSCGGFTIGYCNNNSGPCVCSNSSYGSGCPTYTDWTCPATVCPSGTCTYDSGVSCSSTLDMCNYSSSAANSKSCGGTCGASATSTPTTAPTSAPTTGPTATKAPTPTTPPACTPTSTCASQGAQCGTIYNGCTNVNCGSCGAGQTCRVNSCVAASPTPTRIPGSTSTPTPTRAPTSTSTPTATPTPVYYTIYGNVFVDTDSNGIKCVNGTNLGPAPTSCTTESNYTIPPALNLIVCTGTQTSCTPPVETVQTDTNGTYTAPNLTAGQYTISLSLPDGFGYKITSFSWWTVTVGRSCTTGAAGNDGAQCQQNLTQR